MNKSWYKVASIFSILIGIIFILNFMLMWTIVVAIILFYVGFLFWKVGSEKVKENKLIKSSAILAIIGIVLFSVSAIVVLICGLTSGEAGCLLLMVPGIILTLILYGVAVILLIVNRFRSK